MSSERKFSSAIFLSTLTLAAALVFQVGQPAAAQTTAELQEEITDISDSVKEKKAELEGLSKKQNRLRALVREKKSEAVTLADQVALFDNRIARTQLDIDIARGEIKQVDAEIKLVERKISTKEDEIRREKVILGSLARQLYRSQFHRNPVDILLANDSFADYFDEIQRVSELQSGVSKSLAIVSETKEQLEADRDLREQKRLAIEERKRDLDVAKRELEDDKALKEAVLLETQASELEYRYLLAELQREQNEADAEIANLERALRQKMNLADRIGNDAASVLSWPVVPSRGLSALFHDPDYPFRHVYEHPAIDIRAYQGTPVRASAAGIVARAKDAGMGYSYIMIIHNNNLSTVYGHISRILVREDAFVERGEIIGYSGGMPGTPGAGRMTTGPHLHYETRVSGIPADPLKYLVDL